MLLVILAATVMAACNDPSVYSGDVYRANEAKGERQVAYGTLIAAREVTLQTNTDEHGALGMGTGAVLGGVVGNTMGGGSGRNVTTAVGAVLGGVVGNKVQHGVGKKQALELEIRRDDGKVIAVVQTISPQTSFYAGQRVRIVGSGSNVNVSPL